MKATGEIFFHEGNGHNYSLEIFPDGKCLMNRYYTNGHINREYEKSEKISMGRMSGFLGKDVRELNGKYHPELKEQAERVWFTELGKFNHAIRISGPGKPGKGIKTL